MNRFWSLLFLMVPILGLSIVLGAAMDLGPLRDRWMPESIGPRAETIDQLMNRVHVVIGVIFGLTGFSLALILWRFGSPANPQASHRSKNIWLELLWTIVPAGILVWLAISQTQPWEAHKVDHPTIVFVGADSDPRQKPLLRVEARQFGWRFVYPGLDGLFDSRDDIISESEFKVPCGEMIVFEMVSEDVIHSFCINELRLKQDIVPGMKPRIWFQIDQPGSWQVVCTELCGWGHYKMQAQFSAVAQSEFDQWMRDMRRQQFFYDSEASEVQ